MTKRFLELLYEKKSKLDEIEVTANSDGSFTKLTTSHHEGCRGRFPCGCLPIRITDRYYPS